MDSSDITPSPASLGAHLDSLEAALAEPSGPLADLETPALVVHGEALDANIAAMAAFARDAGVALRPHAKSHKCAEIAARQVSAGAAGIATATLREAEALAAGLADILVTSPFAGSGTAARAADLSRATRLSVVVDHPDQVAALVEALGMGDRSLAVLVDCDVGQRRTGVTSPAEAVDLARRVAAAPRLSFAGIQAYAGHIQHVIDPAERARAAGDVAGKVRAVADALAAAGLAPPVVTGSGTGTHRLDAAGPFTELQTGSYVFMDADYDAVRDDAGNPPAFRPSLFVLATVVSTCRPGEVTVDAGTKSLATNGPPPAVILGTGGAATYRFAGDEHGILTLAADRPAPPVGARVLLGATHCDPTVNLFATLSVLDGRELRKWPVRGRH